MARNADDFVGFRVSKELKQFWEEQADKEKRSLSNWIQCLLPSPAHENHRRKGNKAA